ncbi:MAG: HAMP domain-containing protein, partial [Verrucomicrobiota bacterium]|nr:HAMP domain-containing protein [Verrucomicrobiota bacterium]
VDAKGEILELKNTVNIMVDQLNSFASEVTRVAREVGTEGKLGGQAEVSGVAGTWKDLTDNVNFMAANLTGQVRNIADVTTAVAKGDLNRKITVDAKGEILELKNTINTMVDQLSSFAVEVTRVAREVGTEGKLGGQADVKGVGGTWKDLTDNVNFMAANLTNQVRNIATVTTAVANGDLSKKITVDARGEILELKNTVNIMVDQLNSFAAEVTRVAREVGTEGKLGGQAQVRGVSGTWKDLTDNVNFMAANLTDQVRGIARVVTAVATGNLRLKLTVEAKGEIAALAETINNMIDTLATFADQVTGVAREVGVEGQLGGQANVPGVAGTWKDLTDNVNRLAANLTTQVRAIAEVSTAVTKGDLSRSITVEASGEVALLKDNVNEMIRNLKGTTQKNTEQDWLKTNLATFTRKLQGQRDLQTVCKMTLSEMAPLVGAQHGVFFINEEQHDEALLKLLASYAYRDRKHLANQFKSGEGLIGQCLLEKERILLTDVPDDYVKIGSGLGEGRPANVVVLPVIFEGAVKAIIELASFQQFSDIHLTFLDQLMESLGIVLNTIQTNMRTEDLLKQSQSLTNELQSQQSELTDKNKRLEDQARSLQASEELLKEQQEELQQTNEELQEKASLLSQQKSEVEGKNVEVENARVALQTKAEELTLTSKYKSEFLSNMSHELRTPLNSLLILSKMLADNTESNLTDKQIEYAKTIHDSGSDLLELINEILDLSKIESGTMSVDVSEVAFAELIDFSERTFRHIAEARKLNFGLEVDPNLPRTMRSDGKRVQQVLKNLLSNSFKFTEAGEVNLTIRVATHGWSPEDHRLNEARLVVAFDVRDTGVGIAPDKLHIIFEAFQQAEAGTARKYGGTGLGLSISREIARMLNGTLQVASEAGKGSTFTLYLPISYTPAPQGGRGSGSTASRAGRGGSAGGQPSVAESMSEIAAEISALKNRLSQPGAGWGGEPAEAPAAWELEDAPDPMTGTADDRHDLTAGDQVLLIVENDESFARLLVDLARDKGFKCVVALGAEQALRHMREFKPAAVTLDLCLPDGDGWALLDRWKHDPTTRHVPVHICSVEEAEDRGLRMGAMSYLRKPITREAIDAALGQTKEFLKRREKNLLVVEDDERDRKAIMDLIGNSDVHLIGVGTAEEALAVLEKEPVDCMVVDLKLPGMSGFELIHQVKKMSRYSTLPVIVYTGRELTKNEETELRRLTEAVIIKDVKSPERLLDETALFLHRVQSK